jgi:hypothetical protein
LCDASRESAHLGVWKVSEAVAPTVGTLEARGLGQHAHVAEHEVERDASSGSVLERSRLVIA